MPSNSIRALGALILLLPALASADVFINEIHYDDSETPTTGDQNEGIEVVATAGENLADYDLVLYNGGSNGSAATTYDTDAVPAGSIVSCGSNVRIAAMMYTAPAQVQNGSFDAVALVRRSPQQVVQFLSYEGVATASNGPASGMTSVDIGVSEGGSTPEGTSLQLGGNSTTYAGFTWSASASATFGACNNGQTFGTPVDNPPGVQTSIPANDANDVAADTAISVTFNEPVDTLSSAWFTFTCGAGTPTLTPSAGPATTFTLTKSGPLPFGSTCSLIVIGNQIRDRDGTPNLMAADETIEFRVVADDLPEVVSTTPAPNATDVPRSADLVVVFSEPVDAPASAFRILCPETDVTSLPFALDSDDDTTFRLTPTDPLPAATECRFRIDRTQIFDRDGTLDSPLADTNHIFTTADATAPKVLSTTPDDGATGFPATGSLQVVFDIDVELDPGAFALSCSASTGISLGHATQGSSFTITTGTTLAAGDDCTFTIEADAVTSIDGLNPDDDEIVEFTVAATGPGNYYNGIDASSCSVLRSGLHALIDDHNVLPYSGALSVWTMVEAGEQDPLDENRVLDIYFNKSFAKPGDRDNGTSQPQGTRYNREHTWPQSLGFSSENGNLGFPNAPRSDGHHLFASEKDWNADRGNKPFADCPPPGCSSRHTLTHPVTGGAGTNAACNHAAGNCNWVQGPDGNGGSFEVWDRRKGDVARGILYMDVRYEGGVAGPGSNTPGQSEPDLVVTDNRSLIQITSGSPAYMGLKATLLAWHAEDPPDEMERERNALIQSFQNNRNPFVDHPEWAECVFNCNCAAVDVTANNDGYAVDEDASLTRTAANGVLANDTDAQSEPLTALLGTTTTHGTLNLQSDGGFTYQPTANYCGPDSFTYRARDPSGDEATATVSIAVACLNDAPDITSAIGSTLAENSNAATVAGSVAATDADTGATLTYAITAGNGAPAAFQMSGNQIVVLTPSRLDFETTPQFVLTITVSDGSLTDTAQVTINLSDVNEAPTVAEALANRSAVEGVAIAAFSVANGFSDPDAGNDLDFSQTGLPTGLVLDAETGTISGTAAVGTSTGSPYTVTITATDGALTAQQGFQFTVTDGAILIFEDGFEGN